MSLFLIQYLILKNVYMKKDLSKIASQKKIKYFLVSFVDLFGIQRAKLVPPRAISEMQKTGAGFGGCCIFLINKNDTEQIFDTLSSHFSDIKFVDVI